MAPLVQLKLIDVGRVDISLDGTPDYRWTVHVPTYHVRTDRLKVSSAKRPDVRVNKLIFLPDRH